MADRERLLHKRYQLQRAIAQGQNCTIYLAFDQVLQRIVTIKVIPAEHIAVYKASIRLTAQFSHANIIGTYDLIQEPDALYLVQEYVDGDNFSTLLQTQLSPYAVADVGVQVCQALLYAGSVTRGVCHGDLTPAVLIRDRRGLVRINDFALPSNVHYFTSWSHVGGSGNAISDTEMPWGKMTDGRRADDTRAIGLLLYQLLSGRPPGSTSVEPPSDGRLRFLRNVPVELCEIIARTVVTQHPQHINTPEVLYEELQKQVEALELVAEPVLARSSQTGGIFKGQSSASTSNPVSPGAEKLVTSLPTRESGPGGVGLSSFSTEGNASMGAMQPQTQHPPFGQSTKDTPFLLTPSGGPQTEAHSTPRLSIAMLILFCVIVFVAFFVIGYFVAHAIL